MHRFVVALFASVLGLALVAADPAPSILGTPVLVVYPFAVNGSAVTKEAGSRLAVAIATQISGLGGVVVKPATAGVERQEYLDGAQRQSADYYIAGYMTPLGDGVSVVEQLVSTQTGIVVFSNTAQIRTYADAADQGDVLREALLHHQSRNLGAYAAPPPPVNTPTPTPAPGSAGQANLGRLFGRKQQRASAVTTAAPTPRAQATLAAAVAPTAPPPVPPSPPPIAARGSGYGVLAIGGSAQTERRAFTGAAIRNDVIARHRRVADIGGTSAAACREQDVGTLLGGNLVTRGHELLGQRRTLATLEFLAFDCAGNLVYRKTFAHDARGDWKSAVDSVVSSAIAEFLRTPAGTQHG